MNQEKKSQIDLLVSSFDDKTDKGTERIANVVAAFPVKDETIIPEFIEALMKLSSCPYSKWEETKSNLEDRKEKIISFLSGEEEEFAFEDKTYSFLSVPYEPEESNKAKEEDKFPYVYVKFDENRIMPEIAYESLEKGREIPSLCVPVVRNGSWPGLAFGVSMPFTVKDKQLHMFDREGKPCGNPVSCALPLIGGFYLVETSEEVSFIVNRKGDKVIGEGIKVYSPYNGYCIFSKEGKYGFLTEWGDICEPKFDDIDAIDMGAAVRVKSGDQWGYVTTDNEFVTEEQQEEECYDIYCGVDF